MYIRIEDNTWHTSNTLFLRLQPRRSIHIEENLELIYVFGLVSRERTCFSWTSKSCKFAVLMLIDDRYISVCFVGEKRYVDGPTSGSRSWSNRLLDVMSPFKTCVSIRSFFRFIYYFRSDIDTGVLIYQSGFTTVHILWPKSLVVRINGRFTIIQFNAIDQKSFSVFNQYWSRQKLTTSYFDIWLIFPFLIYYI